MYMACLKIGDPPPNSITCLLFPFETQPNRVFPSKTDTDPDSGDLPTELCTQLHGGPMLRVVPQRAIPMEVGDPLGR